jgi:hypothetical protein
LNVRQIRRIDHHPVQSAEVISPEWISDTNNWLDLNGDLDNPNAGRDDWNADNKSDIQLDNTIKDLVWAMHREVSTPPNIS